jgi:hypothetical protein
MANEWWWIRNDLEGCGRGIIEVLSWHLPGGTIHKNLSQDSRCPEGESSPAPPEYKSWALLLDQHVTSYNHRMNRVQDGRAINLSSWSGQWNRRIRYIPHSNPDRVLVVLTGFKRVASVPPMAYTRLLPQPHDSSLTVTTKNSTQHNVSRRAVLAEGFHGFPRSSQWDARTILQMETITSFYILSNSLFSIFQSLYAI